MSPQAVFHRALTSRYLHNRNTHNPNTVHQQADFHSAQSRQSRFSLSTKPVTGQCMSKLPPSMTRGMSVPTEPKSSCCGLPVRSDAERTFHEHGDAIAGATYGMRAAQPVILMKALEEGSFADASAMEALSASAGAGSVIEMSLTSARLYSCASVLMHEKAIRKSFDECQKKIDECQKKILPVVNQFSSEQADKVALNALASEVLDTRAAMTSLKNAHDEIQIRTMECVRYTGVSSAAKGVMIANQLLAGAVHAISLTAGIFAPIAAGLMVISGCMKWRAAKKEFESAQAVEKTVSNALSAAKEIAFDDQLFKAISKHVQDKRQAVLDRAKDKRFRAKIEVAAGAAIALFSAAAFGFPPLALAALGIGALYAAYRFFVVGLPSFFSVRAAKKHTEKLRLDVDRPSFESLLGCDKNVLDLNLARAETNPYCAVRCLTECIKTQGKSMPWLSKLLEEMGVPKAEVSLMERLAKKDVKQASQMLEEMLLGESFLKNP